MMTRLIRAWLRRVAVPTLAPRFGHEARAVVDEAFDRYERKRTTIPAEPGLGGRLMTHGAAITIALYRTLRARGLSECEATQVTASVTGAVYERMAAVPWLVARLATGSTSMRLRVATSLFRRFPFAPPAYVMCDVPAERGTVAFDVRRCPVAEHFTAEGLPGLCIASWCNLDYPLATRWGADLERRGTLVGGADRCDFRWRAKTSLRRPSRRPA